MAPSIIDSDIADTIVDRRSELTRLCSTADSSGQTAPCDR